MRAYFSVDSSTVFLYISVIELIVAVVTAALNMYFSLRISQLSTISPSLRTIMTTETILASILPFVHFATNQIPEPLYSFENGHYIRGTIFYGIMIFYQIIVVLFECKYLLIALERCVAYNARKDYENRGSELAYKLMGITLIITIPALALKWTIIWMVFEDAPLDLRLRKTFVLEAYFNGLLSSYGGVLILAVGAVAAFLWLNYKISNYHSYESSLSESYEIRQTKVVLHYIKSLLISFGGLLLACGVGTVTILYLKYVRQFEDNSVEIRIVLIFVYISLSIYNFVSMLFMISSFPRLQNVILKDFPFLDGRSYAINSTPQRDHAEASQMYFRQLKNAWGTK